MYSITLFLATLLATSLGTAKPINTLHPRLPDLNSALGTDSIVSLPFPLPPTSTPTTDQVQAGVHVCEHVNWGGKCEHFYHAVETCVQLDGKASSLGPDKGASCLFFVNHNCTREGIKEADFVRLDYPGSDNLGATYKGNFNDRIFSYSCSPTT
ncbi:hypothetical protein GQ44DRAFT_730251 [Phaeosphaeriaceae sp. PMI808]|nr:hypothetical protein GQ44DRAFT_730251 [Phaeosphaeriaceae sp. PMI808]